MTNAGILALDPHLHHTKELDNWQSFKVQFGLWGIQVTADHEQKQVQYSSNSVGEKDEHVYAIKAKIYNV